jgi:hypothetical protein
LDATDPTIRPDAAEVDLLDALTYLTANLSAATEALLRRLFEATNLTVRLWDGGNHVAISIRLPADTLPQIVSTVEDISQTINEPAQHLVNHARRLCGCCTCTWRALIRTALMR